MALQVFFFWVDVCDSYEALYQCQDRDTEMRGTRWGNRVSHPSDKVAGVIEQGPRAQGPLHMQCFLIMKFNKISLL